MKKLAPFLSALLLLGAGCFGSGSTNVSTNGGSAPKPAPAPMPQEKVAASTSVTLQEQNNSGESGVATLTDAGSGKTKVVLSMAGAPKDVSQPAHIHLGTCAEIGAVSYPLSYPLNGYSETVLDVTLDTLLKAGGHLAINVHKSVAMPNVYVACGDLK